MPVETPLPEGVTKDQALYHVGRLQASCKLLRYLDSGDYPLSHYSSGETNPRKVVKTSFAGERIKEIVEEPVSLPVFGTTPRDIHCLRFAVCSAIFSDLQLLSKWGGHNEAIQMIEDSKLFPKKGTVYER